jgi:hypothetical protein
VKVSALGWLFLLSLITHGTNIKYMKHWLNDRHAGTHFFPTWRISPQWARDSSLSGLQDHTQTHHTRQTPLWTSLGPTQRPLPENTQRSQEANIHVLGGVRTHNASKRAVADSHGHWNRPSIHYVRNIWVIMISLVNK